MKCVRFFIVALVVSVLSEPADAQNLHLAKSSAIESFLETYPGGYLRWNNDRTEIEVLSGVRIPGAAGTPQEVAATFIKTNPILFGADLEFKYVGHRDSRAGGRRILFSATRNHGKRAISEILVGVNRRFTGERSFTDSSGKVAPAGYVFITTKEDRSYDESRSDWYIYFINQSFDSELDTDHHPALADAASGNHTSGITSHVGPFGQLSLAPSGSRLPKSFCPGDDFTGVGAGTVYPTNPGLSEAVQVTLTNLCNQSPTILDGTWINVIPESGDRISDPQGSFAFSPTDPEFDEVSVYYHIQNFMSMLLEIGLDPERASDFRLEAKVRSSLPVTAVVEKRTRTLIFGNPGTPYLNVLRESAVIAHETMHLVMHALYSESYLALGEKQHWVMGEAYADYFGLVYRSRQLGHSEPWKNPIVGSYFVLTPTPDLPRDLSSSEPHFSGYSAVNYAGNGEGYSFQYDNAMIFSTALMDYDRRDQSDYSAAFVLESLSNIVSTPTFIKGRDALVQAIDECSFIGSDLVVCCESSNCRNTALEAFADRGIVGSTGSDLNSRSIPEPDRAFRISGLYPNPFSDHVRIEFESDASIHVRIEIYDALGRGIDEIWNAQAGAGRHTVEWRPKSLSAGTYFLEMSDGRHVLRETLKRIQIQ